jgi:uncharacterized protein DUF4190
MAGQQGASSTAVWALVLGIVGIVLGCGPITGIPAWLMGSNELKAIDAGQSSPAGRAMAQIGMILGIVATLLGCLSILAVVAWFALGISFMGVRPR